MATWGPGAPAGVSRQIIHLNGQFPGPTLECTQDDQMVVHFVNHINEPVSIHWRVSLNIHSGLLIAGEKQKLLSNRPRVIRSRARRDDVTPILPGEEQVYSFVCDHPGTFW